MILALLSGFAFLLGIAVGVFWVPPLYCLFFGIPFGRKGCFFMVFFCLGLFRLASFEEALEEVPFEPGFQELVGVIVREPDHRGTWQRVDVETEQGLVRVTLNAYEPLFYGDQLLVSGDLELVQEPYLQRQGVHAQMAFADLLERWEGASSIPRVLFSFKAFLQARLRSLLPESEAGFAEGLLLGSRAGLSQELTEAFQGVGLYHIVAISGSNISLVILVFFTVFSFLPFHRRVLISLLSVAAFILFVGASSTVVRAGVMGSLSLWGLYFGRKSTALLALFWSVVGLSMWNPYMLLYDLGFQLSIASTLGILLFQSPLQQVLARFFHYLPSWTYFFQEAFILSLSAQIATLPLMLFAFERFSWVSPFVNVLVAPLIPLAMLFSALSLLFPLCVPLAWSSLKSIEMLALLGFHIPWAELPLKLSSVAFSWALSLELVFLLLFYRSIWIRAFFRHRKGFFSKE